MGPDLALERPEAWARGFRHQVPLEALAVLQSATATRPLRVVRMRVVPEIGSCRRTLASISRGQRGAAEGFGQSAYEQATAKVVGVVPAMPAAGKGGDTDDRWGYNRTCIRSERVVMRCLTWLQVPRRVRQWPRASCRLRRDE